MVCRTGEGGGKPEVPGRRGTSGRHAGSADAHAASVPSLVRGRRPDEWLWRPRCDAPGGGDTADRVVTAARALSGILVGETPLRQLTVDLGRIPATSEPESRLQAVFIVTMLLPASVRVVHACGLSQEVLALMAGLEFRARDVFDLGRTLWPALHRRGLLNELRAREQARRFHGGDRRPLAENVHFALVEQGTGFQPGSGAVLAAIFRVGRLANYVYVAGWQRGALTVTPVAGTRDVPVWLPSALTLVGGSPGR